MAAKNVIHGNYDPSKVLSLCVGNINGLEVWLGGNTIASDIEDDWVWTEGDPVTGNLWATNRGEGDCMVLLDSYWNQRECEGGKTPERAFLAQGGDAYLITFSPASLKIYYRASQDNHIKTNS